MLILAQPPAVRASNGGSILRETVSKALTIRYISEFRACEIAMIAPALHSAASKSDKKETLGANLALMSAHSVDPQVRRKLLTAWAEGRWFRDLRLKAFETGAKGHLGRMFFAAFTMMQVLA